MFKKFLLFVACLLMVCSAIAESPSGAVSVDGMWRMSLDADGKVTALTMKPGQIKDVLREKMEGAIRGWSFEPGAVNGKPAATDTNLHVAITLWPTSGGESFSIKVASVSTGADVGKIGNMPRFSQGQLARARFKNVNLMVMLVVSFDALGKPTKVDVDNLSPVKEGSLVIDAIGAIRTWTFLPEQVAGFGVAGRVLLPICYVVTRNGDCTRPSSDGEIPVESGRSIALDSSVQLKSDVIGKTL